MKKIVTSLLFLSSLVNFMVAQTIELPFYKETEHFIVYAQPQDHEVANKIIEEGEIFFAQMVNDFQCCSTKKISYEIYPNIALLHQAINWPEAPDWVVVQDDINIIKMVSPLNPGNFHTYDSVIVCGLGGIVYQFIQCIQDIYKKPIPRWIIQGITLYKTDYYSSNKIKRLQDIISDLPTIEQLEKPGLKDNLEFEALHGFIVSFFLVNFIVKTWGWDATIQLLQDYSCFEEILGINKQTLRNRWLEFITNCKTH